jgi:enamine deaminase RidA (YjgF/YER057c/UK114 family)
VGRRGRRSPGIAAPSLRCLQIIERALKELGCDRRSVIRTRIFVTDISRGAEVMRAHGEFFAECPPAATLVQVSALVDPQMLVEIEADAVMAV